MVDKSLKLDVPDPPLYSGEAFRRKEWDRIDWARIGRAVSFYEKCGFTYIEVPWYVDERFVEVTYPETLSPTHDFQTKRGELVGSAEQSFLQLTAAGELPSYVNKAKWLAVTPCFRDNQPDDEFHYPYFMKAELYWPWAEPSSVAALLSAAFEFFISEGAAPEIVKTDEGWDLNVGGIEVGSYGFREVADLQWAYGTAVAEPRFSQALRHQGMYIWDQVEDEP